MRSKPSYRISGELKAPPSKSAMIRALAGSLLHCEITTIHNPSFCDDAKSAMKILEDYGCEISIKTDTVIINSEKSIPPKVINVGESALTLHLFTLLRAFDDTEFEVIGEKTILDRDFSQLIEILRKLGKQVECDNNRLPFKVSGKITNTTIIYDFTKGSQALSGLLYLYSLLGKGKILTDKIVSKNYIDLTLDMLNNFGFGFNRKEYSDFDFKSKDITNNDIYIEGDWSGAAFLLVAAAMSGELKINNISSQTKQADMKILEALEDFGAKFIQSDDSIIIKKSNHRAFEFDASDCPDLFPPLMILAMSTDGKSVIHGVDRLRNKESDRASVLVNEFSQLDANVYIEGNDMIVHGRSLISGSINSHGDHRIAMAAKTAELIVDGKIEIIDSVCVNKSYPNFYKDFDKVKIEL